MEEAGRVQHPGKQTRWLEWAAEEPGMCTKRRTWGKLCLKTASQQLIAERWMKRIPSSFGEVLICSWIWPGSSRLHVRRRNSPQLPETAGIGRVFSPQFPQKNHSNLSSGQHTTLQTHRHFIAQTSWVQHVVLPMSNNNLHPSVSICHKARANFLYTTIISLFSISNKTFTWDY